MELTNPVEDEYIPLPYIPLPMPKLEEVFLYMANGLSEEDACHQASVAPSTFSFQCSFDLKLQEKMSAAIKKRADHWAHKVMKDIDDIPTKEEAHGKKLQFDKLKWLAEIDNPDKYGPKSKQTVDVTHNIQISTKNMSIEEAKKILNNDPFSVPLDADYRTLEEEISKEKPPKEYSL